MATFDLILKSGQALVGSSPSETELKSVDIGIKNQLITKIEENLSPELAKETLDCSELTVLPGLIDTQVHFREPGLTHKEDIASGSRGAVLGGIVAYFEMPNTHPPTTNKIALIEKIEIAEKTSWCDYAFYAGATLENLQELQEMIQLPGCCGVKIFMGSSTGNLLVDELAGLEKIIASVKAPIAVHAEDETSLKKNFQRIPKGAEASYHPLWRNEETALRATKNLLTAAKKANRKVHILHVSTASEMNLLKENKNYATVECTPQHLTLRAPQCYEKIGSLAQMNPPIRDENHQKGLWKGITNGTVDIIGSDHAPHTLEEKQLPYPKSPSGMPGVQTILPLMLDHVAKGKLSLSRLVELMHFNPLRIFSIKSKGGIALEKEASFSIVDLKRENTITNAWMASKSAWTPFHGTSVKGWPEGTIIRGQKVMWRGELSPPQKMQNLEFEKPS